MPPTPMYVPKNLAVVVEDDPDQSELVTLLLEESELTVIACRTAADHAGLRRRRMKAMAPAPRPNVAMPTGSGTAFSVSLLANVA